jgi:hypothetical protein
VNYIFMLGSNVKDGISFKGGDLYAPVVNKPRQ